MIMDPITPQSGSSVHPSKNCIIGTKSVILTICNCDFHRLFFSRLVLLEKVKNHFYFDYFTPLACPFTVHCSASDEFWSYDLSALKNYEENLKVENTYFSVCKPLNSLSSCPPGSAICEQVGDKFVGYGVAVDPPSVIKTLEVAINYEGGSLCDEDRNVRYNSTIAFICNPSVFPGKPQLGKLSFYLKKIEEIRRV